MLVFDTADENSIERTLYMNKHRSPLIAAMHMIFCEKLDEQHQERIEAKLDRCSHTTRRLDSCPVCGTEEMW